MAYDERLADRVREFLVVDARIEEALIEEKLMMGGVTFMINGKMCLGVIKDELVVRFDPLLYEEALEKPGCRPMDFTGKPMKGWIFISPEGLDKVKELAYWVGLALAYNQKARSSTK